MRQGAICGLVFLLLFPLWPAAHAEPLWQVEGQGHRLFLSGSIHLLRQEDYPLPGAFDRAYRSADRLIFETDIAATRTADFASAMQQALRLPKGRHLADRLSDDTLMRAQQRLRQMGGSMAAFEDFRPALLALSLSLMELQRLGVDAPGVDEALFQRARRAGKPIGWLETPQQQIAFIARIGEGEEDALIRQTLDELNSLEREYQRMVTAWREGDLTALEQLMLKPMRRQAPGLYRSLIVDRNRLWLPQIERLLRDAPVELIIVGSAHLAGPDGLIAALKQRGWKITRMEPASVAAPGSASADSR